MANINSFNFFKKYQGGTSTKKPAVFGLDVGETSTDQIPSIIGKQPKSPFGKFGRVITEKVERYFKPTKELRSRDFLREIPSSTAKVIGTIGKFSKSVQEEIAKSGASVGMTMATPFRGPEQITSEELTEGQRKFKELIFGKDPIKTLQTRIAEAEVRTKKFGEEKGIKAIEKGALPLSVLGVGLTVGLDFTGWGGGKKQAAKLLAKTNKIDDVIKILKKMGVADDLIPAYSKVITKLNKVDDITKALDKIIDIQKTTKAVPKGFKFKERQFFGSVRAARPDLPLNVGGQYVPRSTDRLAIKAKNLIIDNIDEAEKLVRTRTDDKAIATASELIKHYGDEAQKTTSKAVKDALYEKASDVAHLTARNLTEQGRSIQAASIMGRQTPEGLLKFAAKEINRYNESIVKGRGLLAKGRGLFVKQIPKLTTDQSAMILREFKKIEAMKDGTQKAIAFKQLNNAVADMVPTSLYKKIINVWKAGLLTGAKTSGLNTFSNLFHGVSETIKDVPGVVVDSVASLFTGKRTIGLTVRTKGGIKEGFKKGWRYLSTGYDERNIGAKLDYQRISFGKSKIAKTIQKYEETIFHLMGAEDQPFFYGAKARSLYSQAIAKSKNAGLKGKDAIKFVDDLMASPTDEMLRYAIGDGEMAVFQNQTTLGKIAKAIQKAPGGEVVVPFGRTPSAVANQLINYSPVGIVKAIAQNIGKGRFDQRLFSQAIGRGIIGTAVMYLGTELYKKGMVSLDYPKGEREQKLWEAEGRKPNSIKIGDKWRSVAVLGPGGFILVAGGYYQQGLEETGSTSQALARSGMGGAKSLTDQTFLQGIKQVADAINDPGRFADNYFEGLASSVIPTLVGDVSKALDPKERRTTEGFFGRLKAKIPGVRETLEPKITVLGEERPRGGNWLETMIDPSRPVKIIGGAVAQELRRLTDLGHKVSPTLLGDKEGYKGLSPKENTAMWERAGELTNSKLNNLFNLKQYKNLPDDQKADVVEDVITKSKTIARAQTVMELTEGLSGEELKNKLSELKEGGLMTRTVFNEFLKLQ